MGILNYMQQQDEEDVLSAKVDLRLPGKQRHILMALEVSVTFPEEGVYLDGGRFVFGALAVW